MKSKKIFVIIVTYNGLKWIGKCLESIQGSTYPSLEIIVIDNNSKDGTQKFIKDSYPYTHLIESNLNLGFGKANNIGIEFALSQNASYIFLLNQDAYLFNLSFNKLIEQCESNKKAGILSPIHFAGNKTDLDFGFATYLGPTITPYLLGDIIKNKRKSIYHSNYVNAAAWFVKSEVFEEIGGFHPVFDHYGEDDEFLKRLFKNDYYLYISVDNSIIHDRPQNREKNNFFKNEKTLLRVELLKYFDNNRNSTNSHFIFLISIIKELMKVNLDRASLFLKSYFLFLKKIKQLKNNEITPSLNYNKSYDAK